MAIDPSRDGAADPGTANDKRFFGHPLGLATAFFTEMWERFSFYGMRAFLALYMATAVAKGGMGMSAANAGIVYGLYGASVYLMSLPGGWIADRFWGQRKAVLVGGVLIMLGHIALSLPAIPGFGAIVNALPANGTFYLGLGLIVLGTGLLKPNISTIVGQLYSKDDPRRDAGFTIFYMGINLGAGIAPWLCGYLAQGEGFRAWLIESGIDPNHAWHFGFGLAAVGMLAGVIWFAYASRFLGDAGKYPTVPTDPVVAKQDVTKLYIVLGGVVLVPAIFGVLIATDVLASKSAVADAFGIILSTAALVLFVMMWQKAQDEGERRRLVAMIVLFVGCIAFFGVFEQAGGMLNLFTEKYAEPELFGMTFKATYYQSINSAYIVLLAPVFAGLWLTLNRHRREPTAVTKFGIGMLLNACAFIVLLPALSIIDNGSKISPLFLFALYFFSTMAELCVSPVGLSSMSKLAPKRMAGMVMGIWFLAISIGYYLAGRAGEVAEKQGKWFLFLFLIGMSTVVGIVLLMVAPRIKRLLGEETPAPLPAATVTAE